MSVVNEFDCSTIRQTESTKTLFLTGLNGNYVFKYNIACKPDLDNLMSVRFYFNLEQAKCLIICKTTVNIWNCAVMKFHISNDLPVPSTKYLFMQDKILESVHEQWKEQYASIVIDEIIQSND